MPLMPRFALVVGLGILAVAWLGPLPGLARQSFAAHMTLHIAVVALAAPMLTLAMAGTAVDPVRTMPQWVLPIPASMLELVVVWAWHVPALHHAARHDISAFVLEQTMFAAAGVLLWISAVGGDREQRRLRAGAGIVALLFTSMHMTLLGALFALGTRPLFHHGMSAGTVSSANDQQVGGVIMLLVGGAAYLLGGLWLTAVALRPRSTPSLGAPESTT
jgi:putative membrane protein